MNESLLGSVVKPVEPKEKTPEELEQERLKKLQEERLNERSENSRSRPGAGASGGGDIPAVAATEGEPVVTKLAKMGKMPPREIPPGTPL